MKTYLKIFSITVGIQIFGFLICYKFVAKNPHACVWDESHFFDLT